MDFELFVKLLYEDGLISKEKFACQDFPDFKKIQISHDAYDEQYINVFYDGRTKFHGRVELTHNELYALSIAVNQTLQESKND